MRQHARFLILAFVPLLAGCSTLRSTMDGWRQGRDGLTRPQRELRDALSGGDYARALEWRDDDDLLRAVTTGITTYYAGQYDRSAALMDTAALLADTRMTTSLSKGGLSLVTNDMARPYALRRTERLFVPWYGMLAYARVDSWEDAAVEARRMVALLEQYRSDRDDRERALHGAMQYLAGAVFERAGERDAAAVAYRNAHALVAAYPERPVAPGADSGEVLVVAERGFVAHRATESIRVTLGDDEREGLRGSDESRRGVLDRVGRRLAVADEAGWRQRRGSRIDDDDGDDDLHHVTIAFPSLRRSARPWAGPPRLSLDSATSDLVAVAGFRQAASVDDASQVDEGRERAAMISRELARATAKYAVTKAVRDKQGEAAGAIADLGASLLERADVRSWHLLPQQVVLMRVRLRAGTHQLHLAVGEGASERHLALGQVVVRRGTLVLSPARFWREPAYRGGQR